MKNKEVKVIGISGTPGTGKTSVAEALAQKTGWRVVSVNELARKVGAITGYDCERECYVVDVEKLENALQEAGIEGEVIIEGHLAHFLRVDVLFILRCKPDELRRRLEEKGWSEEKIKENVEAEILDVITQEAFELRRWKRAYEIDTTGRSAWEVADIMLKLLAKENEWQNYTLGSVSWSEELEKLAEDDRGKFL